MKALNTALLVTCLVAVSCAQIPLLKKKDKEFKTHEPDTVAATLRSGSPEQRSQLATELNLMAPNFSDPGAKLNAPCVTFDDVRQRQVRLRADADNAVIVADSGACDSLYLIVFDKEPKSEWRHVQTLRLLSRAQHPEVSFAELLQPGVSDILVHHETTRDSGSVQQQNFVILKLLHNRLVPVLDTVERCELVLPNRPENDADNVEQSQQSSFTVVQADANSGVTSRIVEKAVVKEKKVSLTIYRSWSWDPELERFRATVSDGSEAQRLSPGNRSAKSEATAVQKKAK